MFVGGMWRCTSEHASYSYLSRNTLVGTPQEQEEEAERRHADKGMGANPHGGGRHLGERPTQGKTTRNRPKTRRQRHGCKSTRWRPTPRGATNIRQNSSAWRSWESLRVGPCSARVVGYMGVAGTLHDVCSKARTKIIFDFLSSIWAQVALGALYLALG